jgi:hypothetical protein
MPAGGGSHWERAGCGAATTNPSISGQSANDHFKLWESFISSSLSTGCAMAMEGASMASGTHPARRIGSDKIKHHQFKHQYFHGIFLTSQDLRL